jgi:hypothetical protein
LSRKWRFHCCKLFCPVTRETSQNPLINAFDCIGKSKTKCHVNLPVLHFMCILWQILKLIDQKGIFIPRKGHWGRINNIDMSCIVTVVGRVLTSASTYVSLGFKNHFSNVKNHMHTKKSYFSWQIFLTNNKGKYLEF